MFRKLSKMIFIAPLMGAAALSAGAEGPDQSAIPAQSGVQMSEWGRETRLPELAAPEGARAESAEAELPDFGEFLSEEARTFGAGALDSEQLRKMLANRAIGREDNSALSWMSSRWNSAPGRLANFMTDYAEARLGAVPGVESADINWSPSGDDAFGAFSASGVGVLRPGSMQAFGFQPKIERLEADGRLLGSFGLFHRRGFGDSVVAGVNMFTEHMDDPRQGSFSRWWLGADFSSPWVDADVKRYVGGEGREIHNNGRRFWTYTPDGLSAELRVHSPNLRWLEGYAKFTEWRGRGGNANTRSESFGLTFQPYLGPLAGLRTDAEFAGDDVNVELAYGWTFGKGAVRPQNADPFAVYTEIAKPVASGTTFQITNFQLYEVAHLYETGDRFLAANNIDIAEVYRRVSLSWELVPEYLRISEDIRMHCPPPLYISLLDESDVFEAASGTGGYASLFTTKGVCQTLNGDHTGPHGWWIGNGLGGSYMFIHAAERLDVDAVKLLILSGDGPNSDGVFSDSASLTKIPYAGSHTYAQTYRPNTPRINTLEGVAERYALAKRLLQSDGILQRALTIAVILRANGGECRSDRVDLTDANISEVCNHSANGHAKLERPAVPKGDLPEATPVDSDNGIAAYAAQGHTGEIFRVSAVSEYADVEYTMEQTGQNFSLTVDGTYTIDYDPYGRGYRETKLDLTGDTRIAVIHLTESDAAAGQYVLTLKGDFFYQRNNLNTVTTAYTLAILAQPEKLTASWGDAAAGKVYQLDAAGIAGEEFSWTGGSPQITVRENGEVHVVEGAILTAASTLTLYAEAKSPDMLGALNFTLEGEVTLAPSVAVSERDQNWPAPPLIYATDAHTGPIFTVTAHTPVDSVRFSVAAEKASFQVRAVGTVGIVEISPAIADVTLYVGTVFARLHKADHHSSTLKAAFTVSVLMQEQGEETVIIKDGYVTDASNPAKDFTSPSIPDLQFAEQGDSPGLDVIDGRLRVNSKLEPSESYTLTVRATSSHLRGHLELAVVALNPDLDDPRGLDVLGIAEGCAAPDTLSSSQDRVLYNAVRADSLSLVCAAIRAGGNVNQEGKSLVKTAVSRRVGVAVKRALLANGATVKAPDARRGDVVHYVARYADANMASFMTRYMEKNQGATPPPPTWNDVYGTKDTAPIHMFKSWYFSTRSDDPENNSPEKALPAMVAGGMDINKKDGDENNVLHLMFKRGAKTESLPAILKNGLDLNVVSGDGQLPLSQSIRMDNTVVFRMLMSYANGDNVVVALDLTATEIIDDVSQSPIHVVRDEDTFGQLVDYDNTVLNLTNGDGETLLDILTVSAADEDQVEFAIYVYDEGGECALSVNTDPVEDDDSPDVLRAKAICDGEEEDALDTL